MDLKDKLELGLLRELASRIVELVDSNSDYDWREDLKKNPSSMGFDISIQPDEDLQSSLDAAVSEVAARLKLNSRDIPTFH